MPEESTLFWCDGCGEEICTGEIYYEIGLQRLCRDCLQDFAEEYFRRFREVAE